MKPAPRGRNAEDNWVLPHELGCGGRRAQCFYAASRCRLRPCPTGRLSWRRLKSAMRIFPAYLITGAFPFFRLLRLRHSALQQRAGHGSIAYYSRTRQATSIWPRPQWRLSPPPEGAEPCRSSLSSKIAIGWARLRRAPALETHQQGVIGRILGCA